MGPVACRNAAVTTLTLACGTDRPWSADLNASTFEASTAAITPFYGHLAVAGADGAGMDALREIGLGAERAMLAATGMRGCRGCLVWNGAR
jgi:ATP:dephospho-CoA triphosphoribosyl transferase